MFKDLLVIELAGVLAGPGVGMFFAELGARVIKVENPHTGGDVTRSWHLASENPTNDRPAYFCSVNWGKQSVALNLKSSADLALLRSMLGRADILLTNFVPGQGERMGIVTSFEKSLTNGEINGYGRGVRRPLMQSSKRARVHLSQWTSDQFIRCPLP